MLQNEINELPYIVEQAHVRRMRVALNPSPYDAGLDAVDFGKLSWIFINEVEAEQISGSNDPELAWQFLHERYPQLSVLVTLGSEGSVAHRVEGSGVQIVHQAAFDVEATNTTGAGDTFTGYFVAGLMDGLPLATCMRRASVAAAISVTRDGAAESIPVLAEVEKNPFLP